MIICASIQFFLKLANILKNSKKFGIIKIVYYVFYLRYIKNLYYTEDIL